MTRSDTVQLVGIDIGGTFTDFVVLEGGEVRVAKLPTDRMNPGDVLSRGLELLEADGKATVVHGTTVATNALLERNGARTAFVTTAGFEDVLMLARQQRKQLYRLSQPTETPLVPASRMFGAEERIDANGGVVAALSAQAADAVVEHLRGSGAESVAVSLLFSFANASHEEDLCDRIRAALPDIDISLSSRLLPEFREYERAASTVANAYLNPVVRSYLASLQSALSPDRVMIMHSGAGVTDPDTAASEAARLVLSGPAGGVVGAFREAQQTTGRDDPRIITLDMGGTSTDVCLCDGRIPVSRSSVTAGIPLRFPAVDIDTVGAGGGSVAWIDDGGALRVGPRSAGADPGPACYGRGGREPTVTDANLLLGRLSTERPLGDDPSLRLDREASEEAVGRLGDALSLSPQETAAGIVRIANSIMERALRRVSIAQGLDPADFSLVSFGGAGPLHACSLADALGIREILVPRYPGVTSALGLCLSDIVFERSASVLASAGALAAEPSAMVEAANRLSLEVDRHFESANRAHAIDWSADLRYVGQSHELTVDFEEAPGRASLPQLVDAFHAQHRRRFAYAMESAGVEIVTLRARGIIERGIASPPAPNPASRLKTSPGRSRVFLGEDVSTEIDAFERAAIQAERVYTGPCLVHQADATVFVEPGWRFVLAPGGALRCTREETTR